MSRFTLWSGLIVLFLSGALTGVVGTSLYYQYEEEHRWDKGPAGRQERIMKRLAQDLSLGATQLAEIEPIVKRAHLEVVQVRVRHQSIQVDADVTGFCRGRDDRRAARPQGRPLFRTTWLSLAGSGHQSVGADGEQARRE